MEKLFRSRERNYRSAVLAGICICLLKSMCLCVGSPRDHGDNAESGMNVARVSPRAAIGMNQSAASRVFSQGCHHRAKPSDARNAIAGARIIMS